MRGVGGISFLEKLVGWVLSYLQSRDRQSSLQSSRERCHCRPKEVSVRWFGALAYLSIVVIVKVYSSCKALVKGTPYLHVQGGMQAVILILYTRTEFHIMSNDNCCHYLGL